MKDMYDLDLNEELIMYGKKILRVPGGWIYLLEYLSSNKNTSAVFVPYDNEFDNRVKKIDFTTMTYRDEDY